MTAQEQIVQGFRTCFHDRMVEKDPFVLPQSCQEAQNPPPGVTIPAQVSQQIQAVIEPAAIEARKQDFVSSMGQALWYEIGVFVLTFLLAFLLPRRAQHYDPEAAMAVS